MGARLLRQESEAEYRVRGLDGVIESNRRDCARLRTGIDKARRAGGVYRRQTLAKLRRSLSSHHRGLTRAFFERQAWAGTAAPTTFRRLRWLWAVERLRREILSRWDRVASAEQSIAYWRACIAEQRFTPATRRSYAREIERFTKYRDEALAELQELSEIAVRPYYDWASDGASTEPYLAGAEAWLRRQLEGLGGGK